MNPKCCVSIDTKTETRIDRELKKDGNGYRFFVNYLHSCKHYTMVRQRVHVDQRGVMSCQREGGEIYGLATHGAGRVLSHPIAYTVFAEGMSARQDTV